MKKKSVSMNLIMVLSLSAVALSVLLCAAAVFLQTYRQSLIQNAQTTSRQSIAQVGSTMEDYLDKMNDSLELLVDYYLPLPEAQRQERLQTFLQIRPDVVAVTTYDADGQLQGC